MKGALRKYWLVAFGKHAKKRVAADLASLAFYCQPADPKAKGATDLHQAMKQFTYWPQEELLGRLEDSVLTLALTERKFPDRRIWKNFQLIHRRMPRLRLVEHINEIVERAKERFTESGWSKLEELSWKEDEGARKLLRDISRLKENLSAAKTIDWAQYKDILSRFSDKGHLVNASGNDAALACYARVLELIVDHPRWEKLRKQSEALVFWLLRIGYPGVDDLKEFNRYAAFKADWEQSTKNLRQREAKLAEFQQSGRVIKKSEDDIEDERLMELIAKNDQRAFEKLCRRHEGRVKRKVKEMLHSNLAAEDITQRVFIQVWRAAPTYVPTAKFTTWLIEIAKNLVINEKKRATAEKKRIELEHITRKGSKGTRKTALGVAELHSGYAPEPYSDDAEPDDLTGDVEDYFRSFQ